MNIEIIVDGPADLPMSYINENNFILIPHGVHLKDGDYQDRITIQPKELMDRMRAGAAPKTSQGPTHLILEAFTKIAKEKKQGIYIVFSSGLSGTYSTAVMLRKQVLEEYPDFQMEVIDSKAASVGLGIMVKACVEKVKQNATLAEVTATAQFYANHIRHIFTVEDLVYLARGGRMKKSSAVIGGMLNVKPILELNDGSLIPIDKVRGRKKALQALIDYTVQFADRLSEQTIGIAHADCPAEANELKADLEAIGAKNIMICEVGGAIGSHAGPGTIAIAFLDQLPE